ncbi:MULTISPECIES: DUF6207 family protein [Streptomyces]|uniref:DUF6207 family protein n=1 Tax=Streptomyces TaxID=1883 RepID=UPI0033F59A2E
MVEVAAADDDAALAVQKLLATRWANATGPPMPLTIRLVPRPTDRTRPAPARLQVGHHRIPDARLAHRRPGPVLREHRQQRSEGHQLPQHQEDGDRGGCKCQQQTQGEQRQHCLRAPRAEAVRAVSGHVADAVDRHHGPGHRHE